MRPSHHFQLWDQDFNLVCVLIQKLLNFPFQLSYNAQKLFQNSQNKIQNYRVSQKKRPTLVLLISQLSRCLEIPSWTFFNSPFHVEFENVHFFNIW